MFFYELLTHGIFCAIKVRTECTLARGRHKLSDYSAHVDFVGKKRSDFSVKAE